MDEKGGFKGFSGLSFLYAQHAWLMHRIADTFSGETSAFLDDVRDRTADLLLPRQLQETVTPDGCRQWWIGSPHDCGRRRTFVRVDPRRPEIVWPGQLQVELRCAAPWRDVEDAACCRCAQALSQAGLLPEGHCMIPCDQPDPVDALASHLAALLSEFQVLAARAGEC